MENFFARKEQWRNPEGALHIYILPSGEHLLDRLAAVRTRLEGLSPQLPMMPEAYLHLTVQRLAQFDDEVSQHQLSALGSALTEELGDVPSFTLNLGRPQATADSVVSHATASAGWDSLLASVRSVLQEWGGRELPDPPDSPHLTIAYANAPVADDILAAALRQCVALGDMAVEEVHLVSVTERPEVGVFDFTTYASWSLA